MASLPTIGRMPKAKIRSDGKDKKKGRDAQIEANKTSRDKSVVAPDKKLMGDNAVTWLPYDSIEVVFNGENCWANRQNHHPACITYDFEDEEEIVEEAPAKGGKKSDEARVIKKPRRWEPLLKKEEESLKAQVKPIAPNVSIQSALPPTIVESLRKELIIEIKQNIELHRSKQGVDVQWEVKSETLEEQLWAFLDIHEKWMYIDPDFPKVAALLQDSEKDTEQKTTQAQNVPKTGEPNVAVTDAAAPKADPAAPAAEAKKAKKDDSGGGDPIAERKKFILEILKPKSWNRRGSPYFKGSSSEYRNYLKSQTEKWDDLCQKIDTFNAGADNFPTRRGKKFRGCPCHFNTSEHESIRQYLSKCTEFEKFINLQDEDVIFTVECRIYPLLGGVLSVWLYVGVQETIKEH